MIRGDNVMQGYYKNPEATAEALEGDGWLHTGDLAYEDEDGFFFITGRLKELIIKGGENIAPREIDDILYAHPAVLEAAAFGIDDEHYGQEVMASVALCQECMRANRNYWIYASQNSGRTNHRKKYRYWQNYPRVHRGKFND